MPSSLVRTFTDPDEYAEAFVLCNLQITVIDRGEFVGKCARINLNNLLLQHFSYNLQVVYRSNLLGKRAIIAFIDHPGSNIVQNGIEIDLASVDRLRVDGTYTHRSRGTVYGNVALPLEEMASWGAAVIGCDLTPPRDDLIVKAAPSAIEPLRRLHATALQLAEDAPAVLAQPEAARSLEQALIEAMMHSLDSGEAREDRAAQRQHEAIMRRFHRVVEEHLDEPLYITELCKEVGASERTLNVCCHEHFSMGPKRYLLLRRMHMARRALQASTPGTTTVTEAATQYGFWQLGRFAVEYKALFGESPSATLARVE